HGVNLLEVKNTKLDSPHGARNSRVIRHIDKLACRGGAQSQDRARPRQASNTKSIRRRGGGRAWRESWEAPSCEQASYTSPQREQGSTEPLLARRAGERISAGTPAGSCCPVA